MATNFCDSLLEVRVVGEDCSCRICGLYLEVVLFAERAVRCALEVPWQKVLAG